MELSAEVTMLKKDEQKVKVQNQQILQQQAKLINQNAEVLKLLKGGAFGTVFGGDVESKVLSEQEAEVYDEEVNEVGPFKTLDPSEMSEVKLESFR